MKDIVLALLWLLPKNALSASFGWLSRLQIPLFSALLRDGFAKLYSLDLSEAQYDLAAYPNLFALFTRRLKNNARLIDPNSTLVSPVDGLVSQSGSLGSTDLRLVQAKGRTYSLADLVGDQVLAQRFVGGGFCTIYLAPNDYHRIHCPADGTLVSALYCPGTLWPVNAHSVARIADLFAVNERVTSTIEVQGGGELLVVKVGATNVGRISLSYLPNWATNTNRYGPFSAKAPHRWTPPQPLSMRKGDELGCFELGSTVILVWDKSMVQRGFSLPMITKQKIRMGQSFHGS